jgi:hypothetical protein
VRFGAGVLASLPDEVAQLGLRRYWCPAPRARRHRARDRRRAGRGRLGGRRRIGDRPGQGDRARTRPRRPRPAEQRPVRPGADPLPTAAAVGHQRDERDRARCGGPRRPRRDTDRVADGRGGGAGTDRRAALRGRRRVRTRRRSDALYGARLCGAVLGATTMSLHHKLCHAPSAARRTCWTHRPTPSFCRTRWATTSRPPGHWPSWEGRTTRSRGSPSSPSPCPTRNPRPITLDGVAAVLRAAWRGEPPAPPGRPLRPRAAAGRSAPERCGHGTPPCSP